MSLTDQQRSPRILGKTKRIGSCFCCVPGCTNFRQKDRRAGVKLFYHRIPLHDKKRTKLWLDRIRRDGWFPSRSSRICSIHFEGGKKSDDPKKPGYIPTIFPSRQKPIKRRTTKNSSKTSSPPAKISPGSSASCPSSNTQPLSSPSTASENGLPSPSVLEQVDSAPVRGEQHQVIPSRMDHDYVFPYMHENPLKHEVVRLKLQLQLLQRENENLKKALHLYRQGDNDAKFHYMTYQPNSDTFEVQTVST